MKQNRLAAIDIGTNSIRCIVVEVMKNGKFRVLDDEKATVRLGEGLSTSGRISPAAWERALAALVRMKKIVAGYGVQAIEAVATSAVREAANGAAFIEAIRSEVGIEVAVISGEEEAELASLSVRNHFDMEGVRYAMVDIGGGSLEVVTARGGLIEEIYSLDLGAVFLTEKYLAGDPVKASEIQKLRRYIRRRLKGIFADERPVVQSLVGSGGTITSLAAMVMALRNEEYGSIHRYEVLRSEVVHLLAMLARKSLKERREIPGLNPDRADIIIAGITVVDELMRMFDANLLRVNERGIREGLILKSLRKHELVAEESERHTWRDSVLDFARSCHVEEEHALHVAQLSLQIFDAVNPLYNLGEGARRMLEAAAILHDVGYFINYSSHHKHSYHLIRHADLFGFAPREREIIANIARYHRKALPKKKHDAYLRLVEADRLLVSRLGGILRLADGLDRRRSSVVQSVTCTPANGNFLVTLLSRDEISVELFGAKLKGDLFEDAFKRKLVFVAESPSVEEGPAAAG
ncbi:Ppx/GppA phosphatase family protein [Geobacter pickeringii]|uniref:Exopolyphosphatase n=1 Tax=Geobacter pickeringii TaxID=345632 RepID=A0A0B5BF16_9BACT|nr:Ppx/GppA phosphatase family protein [Geobacter pickeringii]AJE03125.1 exopolyphosphatase [Geobacter pickeringii]